MATKWIAVIDIFSVLSVWGCIPSADTDNSLEWLQARWQNPAQAQTLSPSWACTSLLPKASGNDHSNLTKANIDCDIICVGEFKVVMKRSPFVLLSILIAYPTQSQSIHVHIIWFWPLDFTVLSTTLAPFSCIIMTQAESWHEDRVQWSCSRCWNRGTCRFQANQQRKSCPKSREG